MGAPPNRRYISGLGDEIAQNATGILQEEVSLTKSLYVIFDLGTEGFSKYWHHIISIASEVLSPYRTGANNGKFYSLVQPPRNIPPIITQLMSILNSDVADCQELSVVGK